MVVGDLLLVLSYLAVKLVDHAVDGGVHVFVDGIGKQLGAGEIDRGFGAVPQLVDGEYAVDVGDVIEVTLDAGESC